MKNSVLVIALIATSFLIPFNSAKAQKGLQIGIEGNPQFGWLVNQDDMDSDLHEDLGSYGGAFGISGQYGFNENMGVGLNVLYSFQGSRYKWKSVERTKSLQYLKIPLMYVFNVSIGTDVMFIGKIGPQLGLLTQATLLDKDREKIIDDFSKAFMSYDIGAMASAGISYKLSDYISIDASARYDIGGTNAEDEDYDLNIHNPDDIETPAPASSPRGATRNMTLGLTIGVRYTFM